MGERKSLPSRDRPTVDGNERSPQFMIARRKSAFASIHDRAQHATTKRLFDLKAHGKLSAVVMPYLGEDDSRLKFRARDLVMREDAYAYPTDFSAMSADWIESLSRRGEQLTTGLIAEHAPHLVSAVRARSETAEPPLK
jgi:NTE family protein